MPTSLHPQAKFDPLPPDLDLHDLVDRTPNFSWVQRVSLSQIRNLGQQEFEKLVLIHVIAGGKPLVIEGWDAVLPKPLFSAGWLEKAYDKKQENVRDIPASTDIPMTMGHYLRSMTQLANQWTPLNFRDERRQRLYMKDIDCPVEWHDALQKVIHPNLFYLNGNVSTSGGDARRDDFFSSGATAGPAGDLMSSLPEEMRAQNLMCYIGHEGTFTPAHREMCASLGQNIMVEASGDSGGEKPGSSIWFMTESRDREVVREYFLSMLGHDIEIEKHFAQVNAWKKAPFDIHIVEQEPGDFILIPPLAAHQVWNRGTRTMKVAWNRTTAETLGLALHEALPKARLVCRDEQYKNKAIIYFTLAKYHGELKQLEEEAELRQMSLMGLGQGIVRKSSRAKQLAADFKRLFDLFTEIVVDEMFASKEKDVEFLEFDSCVTCSYCRSNVFNRFLTCKNCVRTLANGDEDTYDICMECYAMGRSCACLSGLQWCEQWSWPELVNNYETWRGMVVKNDGFLDLESSPQPLEVARLRSGKRSVADICQEALKRRPWKDITKPDREKTPSDSEPDGGDDKPKKKPKRKTKKGELRRCHVCCHKDYAYRVHQCTNPGCSEGYCYGVLYRAFDMMPQSVLGDEHWQCPKCLGICNCGHCRRSGSKNPYTPKNTMLGHDTRPIADDRSVEALVDFRVHNLSWLRAAGEESRSKNSRRMQRLREQADNAKSQNLTEQAEAERTMQDDAEAADAPETTSGDANMNGYGDQSHIIGEASGAAPDFGQDISAEQQLEGEAAQQEQAVPLEEAPPGDADETSLYPDPSMLARQHIGMGYYEQDDTPDKILFDPYQPSADSGRPTEDVPEFVKKSIRAAKRKTRRENEDPDFVVGKSHHKKPRVVSEPDFLQSMDPALFGSGPPAPQAFMHEEPAGTWAADLSIQPVEDASTEEPVLPVPPKKMVMPRFDANEPELRHAKPRASYVEVEDMDVDEFEEHGSQAWPILEANTQGGSQNKSAFDIAADAVLSLDGADPAAEDDAPTKTVGNMKVHKKRGRQPKRPSGISDLITAPPDEVGAPAAGDHPPKRRRGRPRKSSNAKAAAESHQSDADSDHDKVVEELEAQLNAEVATDGGQSGRRGRPRRSGITTIAAASVEAEEEESEASEQPEPAPSVSRRATRGRGRPRGSAAVRGAARSSPKMSIAGTSQFMSMAERMALRGKKFKIGQRKPGERQHASASASASESRQPSAGAPEDRDRETLVVDETSVPEDKDNGDESSSSANSIPPDGLASRRTAGYRRGPTVVKLPDVDSEADEATGSEAGSEEDHDVWQRNRGVSNRGRGRDRGRGRAAVTTTRGRGRPPGRRVT